MAGGDELVGSDLGPYRIQSKIGSGATGIVYRATSAQADEPVALKVLHENLGSISGLEGRYRREARILEKLDHPNIVRIRDFGIAERRTYIAMELLEGETLEQLLATGPLKPARAVEIYDPVLDALAEAHAHGVVHRDLKPANVFLHDDGRVMLLDFGLSKMLSVEDEADEDGVLTRKGRIVGTPGYMAPEQITGAFIDVRADVYALGVMLFELLADRRPFHYERRSELLRAHLLEPIPEMTDVREGLEVSEPLRALVRRALDKDAANRFADAREMLVALRELPSHAVRFADDATPRERRRTRSSGAIVTYSEKRQITESGSASMASSAVQDSVPPAAPPPAPPKRGVPFPVLVILGLAITSLAFFLGWSLRS